MNIVALAAGRLLIIAERSRWYQLTMDQPVDALITLAAMNSGLAAGGKAPYATGQHAQHGSVAHEIVMEQRRGCVQPHEVIANCSDGS